MEAIARLYLHQNLQQPFQSRIIPEIHDTHLLVCHAFKGFVSETPYLIQYTAIAPHITGGGVLAEYECLWSCPLEGDLASLGHIVVVLNEIPGHPKVTDLQ